MAVYRCRFCGSVYDEEKEGTRSVNLRSVLCAGWLLIRWCRLTAGQRRLRRMRNPSAGLSRQRMSSQRPVRQRIARQRMFSQGMARQNIIRGWKRRHQTWMVHSPYRQARLLRSAYPGRRFLMIRNMQGWGRTAVIWMRFMRWR